MKKLEIIAEVESIEKAKELLDRLEALSGKHEISANISINKNDYSSWLVDLPIDETAL